MDREQPTQLSSISEDRSLRGGPSKCGRLKLTGTITGLALSIVLVFGTAQKASADGRSRCQHRVEKAEEHYRHEVHEHGKHSRQAEEAKAKLNSEWDHC